MESIITRNIKRVSDGAIVGYTNHLENSSLYIITVDTDNFKCKSMQLNTIGLEAWLDYMNFELE